MTILTFEIYKDYVTFMKYLALYQILFYVYTFSRLNLHVSSKTPCIAELSLQDLTA